MSWVRPPLAAPISYQQLTDGLRSQRAMVVMMGPTTRAQSWRYRSTATARGAKPKRSEDFKSGPLEECRRGWKRCFCVIHASGSITGKFGRRSTGERDGEKAHTVVGEWVTARSWLCDGPLAEQEPVPAPDPLPAGTKISETIDAYLDHYKSRDIQGSTLAKYRTLTNQLGLIALRRATFTSTSSAFATWTDSTGRGKTARRERPRSLSG